MPCSAVTVRARKKSSIIANRKSYMSFPTSHQPRFYATPNFLEIGIKYLNLSSFIQVSTITDEKSAAKFHYIKTVSSKVVAFRVVSIYWQGYDAFPLNSWLELTYPLLIAASVDTFFTFCLVITANMQSKMGFPCSHQLKSYVAPKSRLKFAAHCPVSSCWPSCINSDISN